MLAWAVMVNFISVEKQVSRAMLYIFLLCNLKAFVVESRKQFNFSCKFMVLHVKITRVVVTRKNHACNFQQFSALKIVTCSSTLTKEYNAKVEKTLPLGDSRSTPIRV